MIGGRNGIRKCQDQQGQHDHKREAEIDHRTAMRKRTEDREPGNNRCHDWPGMVLFGYCVGTRIGDIARLTWLKSRYSTTAQRGPVFPTLYRTTPGGKVGLSLQFVTIMDYAKIDRILVRPAAKGIRAQYARGFHSLRHTSNSALANADVSQEMRMKIIGHQSQEVNQIYTHHELEKMRTAIEKLPAI